MAGAKLASIEEKRKALLEEEKQIKDSCEHIGEFTFDKICDYAFDLDEYHVKVEVKCICGDCGEEFTKKFANKDEFYKFRREQIKDRFDEKNLQLLEFLNDYYLDWRKGFHNRDKSIFMKAVDLVESGAELQSIFSGDIQDGWEPDATYKRSRLYSFYAKHRRSYSNNNPFVDEFLYKRFLATRENYTKLAKLIDKISDPSKKIDDNWNQWTGRYNYLAGNHHLFREIFRGTKTVNKDIIRIFNGSNHERLLRFGTKRKEGEDYERHELTDEEIAGTIKKACETYEKENGKKATVIMMKMPGRNEKPPFHYNFKEYKKEKIYMPNFGAEDWSFDEYWDFMKEVGTYKGLKVILAYHVSDEQIIACRMEDFKITQDKPFPRVANYYMLDTNVNYSGLYHKYDI